MLTPIAALAATLTLAAAPAGPSLDALAQVYDETSHVLAEAKFVAAGDRFPSRARRCASTGPPASSRGRGRRPTNLAARCW